MECASPTIQLAGGWSRFASDAAPALPEQRLLPTANLLKAMTSFRGIAPRLERKVFWTHETCDINQRYRKNTQ